MELLANSSMNIWLKPQIEELDFGKDERQY